MAKRKIIVVLDVEETYANGEGIKAGIEGAYAPDEVTVQSVHEYDEVKEEQYLGITTAALLADVENFNDEEEKNWTSEQVFKIADTLADSETFGQNNYAEIEFWAEEMERGDL